MAVKAQTTAVIGVFPNRRLAEDYMSALKRAGFQDDEIGMLSPGEVANHDTSAEDGAAVGVFTGGALGAFAGAIATGLIPGIGPVLAVGILAGVLGGAAAGAAAGGVFGTLVGYGIEEEHAKAYEKEFRLGRTLVVVQSDGRNGEALSILNRHHGSPDRL